METKIKKHLNLKNLINLGRFIYFFLGYLILTALFAFGVVSFGFIFGWSLVIGVELENLKLFYVLVCYGLVFFFIIRQSDVKIF
jgi:hypothetical protein